MRIDRGRGPFLGLVALFSACSPASDRRGAAAIGESSAALIAETPGFFFLPPIMPEQSFTGTFEPRLSPTVEVRELGLAGQLARTVAVFTLTSGPRSPYLRVDSACQCYAV